MSMSSVGSILHSEARIILSSTVSSSNVDNCYTIISECLLDIKLSMLWHPELGFLWKEFYQQSISHLAQRAVQS